MSDKVVKGCDDCPFLCGMYLVCKNPDHKVDGDNYGELFDIVGYEYNHIPSSPDWCPLKKEPITISISNEHPK